MRREPDTPFAGSVARRITFLIVAASALISLIAGGWSLRAQYLAGVEQLEEQFRAIGVSHVPALAANVWSRDGEHVERQLEGIRRLPSVTHAEVIGNLPWATSPQAAAPTADDDGTTLTRTYPLTYLRRDGGAEQVLGQLRVTASLAALNNTLRDRALRILLVERKRPAIPP